MLYYEEVLYDLKNIAFVYLLEDLMSIHITQSILLKMLLIVLVTALLGELKIVVFSSSFRFGLGSAAFFFLLLFYKEVPYLLTGLMTGVFTTFFRISMDSFFLSSFYFSHSFIEHSPIIGYYVTFALFANILKAKKMYEYPIYMGVLGAFADGFANVVELLIRSMTSSEFLLTSVSLGYVMIVAILRSFLVVGLFNMIYVSQMRAIYEEQRQRFEEVQMITSGLYVEVFYLEKLLKEIEAVTAKSYELYGTLKKLDIPHETSQIALTVAQEVHEVKKDSQRVLAGLEKLVKEKNILSELSIKELVQLIVRANQKYAEMLNKEIEFKQETKIDMQIHSVYPFIIMLNNLVANAVEAIKKTGFVEIMIWKEGDELKIHVIDNGEGISPDEKDIIFEPGFTTKFDEEGKASTGIGLSHVKSMVQNLHGRLSLHAKERKTEFVIHVPVESLEGRSDQT